MIKAYIDIGFTGAVITNHFYRNLFNDKVEMTWEEYARYYAHPYYKGRELAEKLDFDLIFGIERTYAPGKDMLVYGIEPEFLIAHPELCAQGIDVWREVVHSVGGFLAYAHPFRQRSYIPDPFTIPDMSKADGVEVYNYCNQKSENDMAFKTFGDGNYRIIAGGDLHIADFTNTYGISVDRRMKTSADVAAVLYSGNYTLKLD